MLSQASLRHFADVGMLSPRGRCCPLDASADGTLMADGAVVLLLRRAADARASGQHILGLLAASTVNHDGYTTVLTAPSPAAQRALTRSTLRASSPHVSAADVTAVEMHGTATPLGDPLEVGTGCRAGREGHPCKEGVATTFLPHCS